MNLVPDFDVIQEKHAQDIQLRKGKPRRRSNFPRADVAAELTITEHYYDTVIGAYDAGADVIETHEHGGDSRSHTVSCSRHVPLPAKMKFHESSFIGLLIREAKRIRPLATLMRDLTVILAVLTVAIFGTRAGSLDWLFDAANHDDAARKEAEFFVWDGVSHPVSATFEKVNLVEKDGPFYLFHVVITSPGARGKRDRSSYLVCFKLAQDRTDFRILTAIQYASDPPTQNEIAIDKRLNRCPVSPPWRAEDDLPRHIKQPGLSIVLDKSRAGPDQ